MIRDFLRRLAGPDRAIVEARERAHTAEVRAEELARKLISSGAERGAAVAEANRARDAALVETEQVRREWGADRRELCGEIARLTEAHHRAAARVEELRDIEPPAGEGCHKIRLRDEDEAALMIASLARDTGRYEDEYETYPCKACPRSPVTSRRYLHIANRDPAERTGRNGSSWREGQRVTTGYARIEGRLLEQRLDPGVAERLRGIAGEAS